MVHAQARNRTIQLYLKREGRSASVSESEAEFTLPSPGSLEKNRECVSEHVVQHDNFSAREERAGRLFFRWQSVLDILPQALWSQL